ncbi:MAG TPA: Wzz/FepE/Etk N-terminal domain-containing protein [Symbiobacteriaceae bacterium]|nr:Wzz/FepE/Etk N-terminal domain-containing protein [Symbiobacteriaceae bacterium]
MDQAELDLREIFRIVRRRLKMLILLPAVAGLVAAVVSYFVLAPVYQASTTIWVVKDGAGQMNYNDLLLNKNLTKTYAEVARSRAVMAEAIRQTGAAGLTEAQLQAKLTVTPVRDTEILSFAVEDENPRQAAALAAAIAEAFKGQIKAFMKVENVSVVDAAQVPVSPIKPRPLMNTAIAVVLGAMAAAGLAFLLEYMDTSLRTADDVDRRLGLPVVGMIPVLTVDTSAPEPDNRRKRAAGRTRNSSVVVGK